MSTLHTDGKTESITRLAPARGSAAAVECEESVILKIRLRRDAGRKKYGTSMERTDLTKLQRNVLRNCL